jgi:arsenate reductase
LAQPPLSKSRQVLHLLNDRGIEPEIVDYQLSPPDAGEISRVLALLSCNASDVIRNGEKIYKELELSKASEGELLAAMAKHPILIERPIVEANGKAALGRPPENVLAIL